VKRFRVDVKPGCGVRSAFNPLVEQYGRLGLSAPELVTLDLTDEARALAEPIRRV